MPRVLLAVLVAAVAGAAALPAGADGRVRDRYALAGGCWTLRAADAPSAPLTAPLRFQATALGSYLLYGRGGTFLTGARDGAPTAAARPSADAVWRVAEAGGGAYTLTLASGRGLAAEDGALVAAAGPGRLAFARAEGCADYPEVEVNATGTPRRRPRFGEARGMLDAHMHMMAFEFLGGLAHCGRPWHPFGAPYALVDCPDHYPNGEAAVLENVQSFGDPLHRHDPVGWPTFRDWPNHRSLTHEQSYYRWLERAWRGGLRVFVNLLVENKVLCEIYPYKRNSCDEMDAVRLQARRIRELEAYIDAQHGGPGRGWFRIVTDPFQARRVVNQGKLAVVLGIEVSEPFGCQVYNDVPRCDTEDIDRQLDEVYDLGVRDMELINKFDNALAGVAGDAGRTGLIVNQGNKYTTGRYWDMRPCTGPPEERDRDQVSPFPEHNHDDLVAEGLAALLPPGQAPVYQPGPLCNSRGLTHLGEHLVRRMIDKGMIVDPDHLGVLARDQVLNILEAERHSGVVSSHSWSTPGTFPRIYRLGGVVTPYAGNSQEFVEAWRAVRAKRSFKHYFGFGWGADMNGLGSQGGPRLDAPNPVRYPFTSFDGAVTLDKQRSGRRVFDINVDGVAHYGLYPDWVEDLRMQAGSAIVEDLARGAEAYLQMWERAIGVPAARCLPRRARLDARGLRRLRLGARTPALLRAGGQPERRVARTYRYCVRGGGRVSAVLDRAGRALLIGSTARGHRAAGLRPGARVAGPPAAVLRAGSAVAEVRGGRVRAVAVAAPRIAGRDGALRRYLRRAR